MIINDELGLNCANQGLKNWAEFQADFDERFRDDP